MELEEIGTGGTMRQLPASEQPYEKCEKYGPQALSDAELLAVIIRTGSAGERATDLSRRLLSSLPGKVLSGLFHVSFEQLCGLKGIGRVKAIQLLCIAEVTKRMFQSRPEGNALICREPREVASHYMPQMCFLETEQVRLLVLNARYALVRELTLSCGTFYSAVAAPREVFHYALKHQAVAILLLHNHPSGDPSPSREDIQITRRVAETGAMIGIPLLDHIIIGNQRYMSFRESGYLEDETSGIS